MSIKSNSVLASYFNRFGATGKDAVDPGGVVAKIYVDDVFSTDLYTGNSPGTQAINNGIDLTEGGLVWSKTRASTTYDDHILVDSEQTGAAAGKMWYLISNNTDARSDLNTFNFSSTGYTVPDNGRMNASGVTMASWTFRKAPGFFDIVEFSGNATARTIPHNLGCVPGMVIVKSTTSSADWFVYHKSVGATYGLLLSETNSKLEYPYFNDTAPTAEVFSVTGAGYNINETGQDYVAYLFADGDDTDAQIFGAGGDESIIKCGTYEGSGTTSNVITVGFEPQYLLIKNIDAASQWMQFDTVRGIPDGTGDAYFHPSDTDAENTSFDFLDIKATGFELKSTDSITNSSHTFIYIAIRKED